MQKIAIWNVACDMRREYPNYHYGHILLLDTTFEGGLGLVRTPLIRIADD